MIGEDRDRSTPVWLYIVIPVVLACAGAGAFFLFRRNRTKAETHGRESGSQESPESTKQESEPQDTAAAPGGSKMCQGQAGQ